MREYKRQKGLKGRNGLLNGDIENGIRFNIVGNIEINFERQYLIVFLIQGIWFIGEFIIGKCVEENGY